MANEVIGIKFGVKGQGAITGDSGARILNQLKQITEAINKKEDRFKIKLNVDQPFFKKQIDTLAKQINAQVSNIKISNDIGALKFTSSPTSASTSKQSELFGELRLRMSELAAEEGKLNAVRNTNSKEYAVRLEQIRELQEQLIAKRTEASQNGLLSSEQISQLDSYNAQLKKGIEAEKQLNEAKRQDQLPKLENAIDKQIAKTGAWIDRNRSLIATQTDVKEKADELEAILKEPIDFKKINAEDAQARLDEIRKKSLELEDAFYRTGAAAGSFGQKLKKSIESKLFNNLAVLFLGVVTRAFRQVYQNVVQLDAAMTQLRIVTRASDKAYEDFSKSIADSAKRIGASIKDLIDSTTVFARLGYSLKDAQMLAEGATIYTKVSGGNIGDTTKNITAIIKAFGIQAQDLTSVLDQMIYVGNNYAISSEEIGNAMNDAASALAANGNSLQEAIGILTAANTTIQNINISSTAVRTMAARISRSSAELQELGESVDDVLSTSRLDAKMRAFGVAIIDANGELRSTYSILADLSKVWDTIGSVDKAAIAEMIAGSRLQNTFFSLMSNWQDAESVVKNAADGVGSLQKANEEYLNSIEGKLNTLKATWESFSQSVLNTDFVKVFVNGLNGIASLLTGITSLGNGFVVWAGAATVALLVAQKFGGTMLKLIPTHSAYEATLKKETMAQYEASIARGQSITMDEAKALAEQKLATTTQAQIVNMKKQVLTSTEYKVALVQEIASIKQKEWANGNLITTEQAYNQLKETGELKEIQQRVTTELTTKAIKEKALAMSMAMLQMAALTLVMMALSTNNKTLKITLSSLAIGFSILLAAIKIFSAESMKALLSSGIGAVIVAIGVAIAGIVSLVQALNKPTLEDLKEAAKEAKETWQELKKELDEVNSKIEETTKRIEELNAIPNRSYVEEKELQDLIKLNNELERQRKELERDVASKGRIAEDTAIAAADAILTRRDSKTDLDGKNAKIKDANGKTIKFGTKSNYEQAQIIVANWERANAEQRAFASQIMGDLKEQQQQMSAANSMSIKIWEELDKYNLATGTWNNLDVFDSLFERENMQDAVSSLKDLANSAKGLNIDVKSLAGNNELIDYFLSITGASLESEEVITALTKKVQELRDFRGVWTNEFSYGEILDDMQPKFDTIQKALSNISSIGIVSPSNIKELEELMEKSEDLKKMFEWTGQGLQLTKDNLGLSEYEVLEKVVSASLQTYIDSLKTIKREALELGLTEVELADGYNISDVRLKQLNLTSEEYQSWVQGIIKEENNLNKAITDGAVLLRSQAIKERTDELNVQKDALNKQADAYKSLIDIRKDLLKTYKQEIDYQKQLAQKQKIVVDLETQLALAKLDTSAAGKAKVRDLESQLETAKETLDDFTLEHAIEVLTKQLDNEYGEYEKLIQTETDKIVAAIEDLPNKLKIDTEGLATNAKKSLLEQDIVSAKTESDTAHQKLYEATTKKDALQNTYDSSTGIAKAMAWIALTAAKLAANKAEQDAEEADTLLEELMKKLELGEYHTGGFVGGLKTNEEFAKLMKGEFVITPPQINNFMNNTLPNVAKGSSNSNNYNAPLVQLTCQSITKESVVDVEKLLNKTVNKVQQIMESGGSRSGRKNIAHPFTRNPV